LSADLSQRHRRCRALARFAKRAKRRKPLVQSVGMEIVQLSEANGRASVAERQVQLRREPGDHVVDVVAIDAEGPARGERAAGLDDGAVRASAEISQHGEPERDVVGERFLVRKLLRRGANAGVELDPVLLTVA
jgi:hypothetical protein